MSASTVDPALAEADPAGYVEAVAALAINDEDPRWREQAALWRGVVERHRLISDHYESLGIDVLCCEACGTGEDQFPCPDLLAAVHAARAYAGGGA